MGRKFILCLLIVFILIIGAIPNFLDESNTFQPPLRVIEAHQNGRQLGLAPNFRLSLQDFFKLTASWARWVMTTDSPQRYILSHFRKRLIVLFFCSFQIFFFIFYQIARTSSKQDDPAFFMNA